MRFQVTLEDGSQLVGDVGLGRVDIGRGTRPSPEATGKAIAEAMVPGLAAQIATELPPATLARRDVRRDPDGKVTGTTEYPAVAPAAIRAEKIARQLAPSIAAQYTTAIASRYASIDAAARATAQATARAQAAVAAQAAAPRSEDPADLARRKVETAARRAVASMGGRTSVLDKQEAMTTKGKTR